MNDAQPVRPTKKQRQLLLFIENFIAEHGYSPSYREIMHGLDYTSVATVSLHVNSLIKRGHVRKRNYSARSLELTGAVSASDKPVKSNEIKPDEEKWLVAQVEFRFGQAEMAEPVEAAKIEELQILLAALNVLGMEGAAQSFAPRLAKLKSKITDEN
jgi:repressor LexA